MRASFISNKIVVVAFLALASATLNMCQSSPPVQKGKEQSIAGPMIPPDLPQEVIELLDTIEYSTFLFFQEKTDEKGFTIESTAWPIGSIASSGFYLTSIPIAIERGWISYEEGRRRILTTLNSYYDDPEAPNDFYVESERGFFPHWFHQATGTWSGVDVFSSIDTAILMAGVLTARQYFVGVEGAEEQEITRLATELYEAVDWDWMTNGGCTLTMGWRPDTGFHSARWQGYNEGMLAVLLALGSPTHPISKERCKDPWEAWAATYSQVKREVGGQPFEFIESTSPALFTYQYPLIWFDLRGKKDKMGVNYFENSRIATLHNRAYSIANPEGHKGYGPCMWGLTASECPLHPSNYGVHGPYPKLDDGTVAPTGAGGSIIFTPQESIEALRCMKETYGNRLWGSYGFKDAFNLDIDWFSPTYVGIQQGAILTMIENYRSSLVQSLFMQNEYVYQALREAGFADVDTTPPAITHVRVQEEQVLARITDNVGIQVAMVFWDDSKAEMVKQGADYTAQLPVGVTRFYIEAKDQLGNVARSRIYSLSESSKLSGTVETKPQILPPDAPTSSLLVDRFDDCISKKGAGAWHGGSSTPQDAMILFDSMVNRDGEGCSLKIRYNVEKDGSFNGAWIKLGHLDLRPYKELVFWVKGDEQVGYTTTFKIELKSSKSTEGKDRLAAYIIEGIGSTWKRMAIPLSEFRIPSWAYEIDWSDVIELTIVFEDRRATDREGALYIDDIYFVK